MGVIYKLKPEIINFILEQKKAIPKISCRKLIPLVEKEFQTKVSKSSINSIFKQAGLSMPAGRRIPKEKPVPLGPAEPQNAPLGAIEASTAFELPSERECPGLILLRAVDNLLCGSQKIAESIKNKLSLGEKELLSLTEGLIYLPLFDLPDSNTHIQELSSLIGRNITAKELFSYLNALQNVRTINLDISQAISDILQEIRCIGINTADGNTTYLDGQFHTIWSGPYIPYDFSISICNIKSYINKYFMENSPIVLFMAPGYDTPTKEFISFLSSLTSSVNYILGISLFGNKLEKLEQLNLPFAKKRKVIFALWPWQFVDLRKVKKMEEFKPVFVDTFDKEFYAAEIEIELLQPQLNQYVTTKGYALKMASDEKTRVLILSNFSEEINGPEELLNLYFGAWPNLEEGFQDFSRKIELFTYTGSSKRFFSPEMLKREERDDIEVSDILKRYLEGLDLYAKWHFLPSEYSEKEFQAVKEHFYGLKTTLKIKQNSTLITFQLPSAYQFQKQLEYACRRLNERQIMLPDKTRLRFLV